MSLRVSRLFIYPIKSLRAVEVDAIELTDAGVRFDRCFTLVESPSQRSQSTAIPPPLVRHLTIKKIFKLALFHPEIDSTWTKLTIQYVGIDPPTAITLPLTPCLSRCEEAFNLNIFGTTAMGIDMGDEVADFFSTHLETSARLVYIGGSGQRDIPGVKYAPDYVERLSHAPNSVRGQKIKFADASPLLITSTASEDDVRRRLPERFRDEDIILRFRPNIHIGAGDGDELPAYDEDTWRTLNICHGNATITCVYPCVRCLSINADIQTGQMSQRNRQLYGLLARDRRVNTSLPHKPVFGQYAFGTPNRAIVRVDDPVTVSERISRSEASPTPV